MTDLSLYISPLKKWRDLSMHDMVFAYRKAKYDCFWERAVSHCRDFAAFEQDLHGNLSELLRLLQSDRRSTIASAYLGERYVVPKLLKTTLEAEIDADAPATLNSDTSRPFPKPESARIAVKVINHLGDKVMKVFRVD